MEVDDDRAISVVELSDNELDEDSASDMVSNFMDNELDEDPTCDVVPDLMDNELDHSFDLVASLFGREFDFKIDGEETLVEECWRTEFEQKLSEMEREVNEVKKTISELCQEEEDRRKWRMNTQKTHLMGGLSKRLGRRHSNAFCKLYQILVKYPELVQTHVTEGFNYCQPLPESMTSKTFYSLHLCEVPGHFLSAIDHYLAIFKPKYKWVWKANSLNPHYEYTKSSDMFLDDQLIVDYPDNWLFGDDNSGDVTKLPNSLRGRRKKFDLVTADGSTYSLDRPEGQEEMVFDILIGEVECALACLKEEGSLVMKVYSSFSPSTCRLFGLLVRQFDKVFLYKPPSSKSGNNERYLICIGWSSEKSMLMVNEDIRKPLSNGHITKQECEKYLACSRYFSELQIQSMQNNIQLFTSPSLATMDVNILGDRAIERVMNEFKMNELLRGADIPTSIFFNQGNRPWKNNFKNNHVKRLKELEDSGMATNFLRSIDGIWLDDDEVHKDWSTSLNFSKHIDVFKSDYAMIVCPRSRAKPDEKVLNSLFVDSELIVVYRTLYHESVDLCRDGIPLDGSNFGRLLTSLSHDVRGYCQLSVNEVPSHFDWIRILQYFHSQIGRPTLKGLTLFYSNRPSSTRPLFLSRFSVSVISMLTIIFKRITIPHPKRDAGYMVEFDMPNCPDDVPYTLDYLKRMIIMFEEGKNILSFVPLGFMAELYPLITFYNNEMLKKVFNDTFKFIRHQYSYESLFDRREIPLPTEQFIVYTLGHLVSSGGKLTSSFLNGVLHTPMPPPLKFLNNVYEHCIKLSDIGTSLGNAPSGIDYSKFPKFVKTRCVKEDFLTFANNARFERQNILAEVKAATATNKGKDDGKKKEKEVKPKKEEFVYQPVKAGEKKNLSGGMPDSYQPRYVEADWYSWWEKEGFFKPEYGGRDVTAKNPKGHFTLCIPPPNVTGTLHVGHALATSVEDSVTRWHRMRGATTLFNPGTDHAGIATQVVVEKRLQREKGLNRHDIGREHFIEEVWRWVNEKGDVIYNQLRDMGASVDWDRAVFMMDPKMKRGVTEAFIRMHESGTIYRSTRLVNWSCSLRSAISDIEVDKKELTGATKLPVPGYEEKVEFGVIVQFAYKIKDSNDELIVATTRVETMLGDTAVCVHPEDERYKHLVGKTIVHPFVKREIPIIADDFVDREFGTGAVKITPAHDPTDYTVGVKHSLPFITCITDDGDMAENCGEFSGMKRFNARVAVMARLEELGLFRGKHDNPMVVPICSRSKDVIEPILKAQWYVACDKMAANAVDAVAKGELKIIPDTHVATWNRWLENSRDWCISRQLWWGHRIPAYFITVNDGGKTPKGDSADNKYWVSAGTEAEALKKAAAKFGVAESAISLKWDEDVLDTWFSSGMWPFIIFGWPDKTVDLESFFPGALLETGHDILFFWVARMVFMSQELTGKIPFKEVFLHAMIRDAHGRKMSKSLGNVIDPRDVIKGVTLAELNKQLESGNLDAKEVVTAQAGQARDYPNGIPECGTDALRFALMAYTSQGRDINLDVLRVQGYRHFCNKIWQAVRFTLMQLGEGFKPADKFTVPSGASPVDRWILSRLSATVAACNNAFETYTFPQATTAIYDFWLYDFCDIYLEAVKPVISGGNAAAIQATREVLLACTTEGLALLSPLMPFVTEELWQRLPRRSSSSAPSIVVAPYPETEEWSFRDESLEKEVAASMGVVKTVRSLRSDYELQPRTKADLLISCSIDAEKESLEKLSALIGTLASSNKVTILSASEESKVPSGCAQMTISASTKVFIALEGVIDAEKEKTKLAGKKSKLEASIGKIEELQKSRDYETKVPLGVRTSNEEKKNELKSELTSIEAAIAALR